MTAPSPAPDQATMTTMPSEWARVDAALDELLALDPSKWDEAVKRISGGDAALADELHSLLAAGLEDAQLRHHAASRDADDLPHGSRLSGADREALAMAAGLRRNKEADAAAAADDARAATDVPTSPSPKVKHLRGGRPVEHSRALGVVLAVVLGVVAAWAWRHYRG